MKKIEIIIPDRALGEVNRVLRDINIGGMSWYKIEGRGRIKAKPVSFGRGTSQYVPEFIPRTKVEAVVADAMFENVLAKIVEKVGGPSYGGKIFVTDIPVAIDLITGKRGEDSI